MSSRRSGSRTPTLSTSARAAICAGGSRSTAPSWTGKPVGHWGGRYIWQLADADALMVGWRVCVAEQTPAEAEATLVRRFKQRSGGCRSPTSPTLRRKGGRYTEAGASPPRSAAARAQHVVSRRNAARSLLRRLVRGTDRDRRPQPERSGVPRSARRHARRREAALRHTCLARCCGSRFADRSASGRSDRVDARLLRARETGVRLCFGPQPGSPKRSGSAFSREASCILISSRRLRSRLGRGSLRRSAGPAASP